MRKLNKSMTLLSGSHSVCPSYMSASKALQHRVFDGVSIRQIPPRLVATRRREGVKGRLSGGSRRTPHHSAPPQGSCRTLVAGLGAAACGKGARHRSVDALLRGAVDGAEQTFSSPIRARKSRPGNILATEPIIHILSTLRERTPHSCRIVVRPRQLPSTPRAIARLHPTTPPS